MFNSSDKQLFSLKKKQIYEKNNLYKMNFKIFETSLNIQNGGVHSTNVKNIQLSITLLILHRFWSNWYQNSWFVKFFTLKLNVFFKRLHSPLMQWKQTQN